MRTPGRDPPGLTTAAERVAVLLDIAALSLAIDDVPILHDVRLHVAEGGIYGLVGPNGAGKSTTIAALLGLLPGAKGRMSVLGQDPRTGAHEVRRRMGVLPEQNGFYDWMTADAYLAFFGEIYGRRLTGSEIEARIEQVGLAPRAGQRIGTYSRGMRQRLGLARALIGDPELVVLDEPTNGLDPRGRREIHDILLELARRGVGVLLATHLLDDVERLCDQVGVLVGGRTVAEGRIAELIGAAGHAERFRLRLAGEPPAGDVAHVHVVAREGEWSIVDVDPGVRPDAAWRELMLTGWPINEIRREGGGLESLYLALTERNSP